MELKTFDDIKDSDYVLKNTPENREKLEGFMEIIDQDYEEFLNSEYIQIGYSNNLIGVNSLEYSLVECEFDGKFGNVKVEDMRYIASFLVKNTEDNLAKLKDFPRSEKFTDSDTWIFINWDGELETQYYAVHKDSVFCNIINKEEN